MSCPTDYFSYSLLCALAKPINLKGRKGKGLRKEKEKEEQNRQLDDGVDRGIFQRLHGATMIGDYLMQPVSF